MAPTSGPTSVTHGTRDSAQGPVVAGLPRCASMAGYGGGRRGAPGNFARVRVLALVSVLFSTV
jgi:hypothetical protein